MSTINDIEALRAALPTRRRYESEKRWQKTHQHKIDDVAFAAAIKFAGQMQLETGREVTASEAIVEMARLLRRK